MNKKTKELNKQNNKLDNQISAENQEAFTNIVCYLRGANISEYDQEVVRQDLTEMVLSAQKRGEDIRAVIGEDYKDFCDNVIANLPPKTTIKKVTDFLDIFCWCLSILLTINIVMARETITLIQDLATGRPLNFNISFTVGGIISIGVILVAAIIIVKVIIKNSFKVEKGKQGVIVKAFLISLGMMILFLLIAWLGKKVLFTLNIFVGVAIVLVLYVMHKILEQL
jgi:DNA-binding ferritin-like protein (Dps family)